MPKKSTIAATTITIVTPEGAVEVGGSSYSDMGPTDPPQEIVGSELVLHPSSTPCQGAGAAVPITVETVSLPDLPTMGDFEFYQSGTTTTISSCGVSTTTTRKMTPGEIYFFSANSYVLCVQRNIPKKVRIGFGA